MPASNRARLVIVTGGGGFIGSHLADALVDCGFRVRAIDNFATGNRERVSPRVELVEADIRDADAIVHAFTEDVDCVFHTAALPEFPLSIAKPVETHMANVVGTLNVLMAVREAKIRRFVYSGSSSVYGNQERLPLVETMTPSPRSPYALQKFVGEEYGRRCSSPLRRRGCGAALLCGLRPADGGRGGVYARDRGVHARAARGPSAQNSRRRRTDARLHPRA